MCAFLLASTTVLLQRCFICLSRCSMGADAFIGQVMAAAAVEEFIYVSTDYGASWRVAESLAGSYFYGVAMNYTGQMIATVVYDVGKYCYYLL